ncbi:glycosyltransferase involved in cell wall biosynthesis [Kushneria sinocarnis]|uniref:Glycosyltransferase involved in cell wall biosynthesis n=1 Tax=Kushneria sinocarnis TaxID=595502 RepID=A0A420WTJ1_9GAMM|nr:glycosyltransferase family 2 protein [Kushneria sinocarnis]RKQ96324.1 glycosyltransferase involved in cell wall biosynthesis [Kushneria sinocarnis]
MTEKDAWTLSLVVPVMNEEEAIDPFLSAIDDTLNDVAPQLEILFIDDGSTDGTAQALTAAAQRDSRVRWLRLTRNFGKEAAMSAGIDHAVGDAVVPMDVDLQDPPELIHEFVRKWRDEGYDMVYGVRGSRHEDTRSKRTSAGLFYSFFNRLSTTTIPSNAGDYRLIDRRIVEALRQLPERSRFMKGLFSWPGYRSVGVYYDRPARQVGSSKFNFWKLWNFALDGLVSFSTWPLRVWSYIGGVVALLSFVYILILITRVLIFGSEVPGYASLMTAILFFGGMQLISIGVLGEYISRLFIEAKQRPLYLIEHDSGAARKPIAQTRPAAKAGAS